MDVAIFLVVGMLGGYKGGTLSKSLPLYSPVFGVSAAIYSLIAASGRLQIREGGIWLYWVLLWWEKITSCQLSDDATLVLQAKSRLPFPGRGALPVPPQQRQAIVGLLQRHCPAFHRQPPD